MKRFKIYYAETLEKLVTLINEQDITFSTVVYFGPNLPLPRLQDHAYIAVFDFLNIPVITDEGMGDSETETEYQNFDLTLSA